MPDTPNPTCYTAKCLCGCGGVIWAAVDLPETKKDIAKEAAKMIRAGYTIEHAMTVEDVRKAPFGCATKRPAREGKEPAA